MKMTAAARKAQPEKKGDKMGGKSRESYQDGVRDGIMCGLVMSAVVAVQETPNNVGDALAASLLRIAGVKDIEGLAALRNDPVDEHNVDYLVCHFGNLGTRRFAELAEGSMG